MPANSKKGKQDFKTTQTRLAYLDILERLLEQKKIKRRTFEVLSEWIAVVRLPFAQVQVDECFHTLCCHEDEITYARSQRAVFVREMNAVLAAWRREGITDISFAVSNFEEDQTAGILHFKPFEYWNAGQLEVVKKQFLKELVCPKEIESEKWWRRAFNQFLFVLVAFDGFAVPNAFAIFARLRWRDVRTAVQGFITIQRFGTQQRLYVSPLAALCAILLAARIAIHLKSREPELDQPILPGLSRRQWQALGRTPAEEIEEVEEAQATMDALKVLNRRRWEFNTWFAALCQSAHLTDVDGNRKTMSLRILTQLAEKVMVEIYDPLVASALVGARPYSQVPNAERDIFASYKFCTEIQAHAQSDAATHDAKAAANPSSPEGNDPGLDDDDVEQTQQVINSLIKGVHLALRPLFKGQPDSRREAIRSLQTFAQELGAHFGCVEFTPQLLAGLYEHKFRKGFGNLLDVAVLNLMTIALWLGQRCSQPRLKHVSIANQRSDAINIVRIFPDRMLNEIDEEDVSELVGTDRSASGCARLMGTLRQLRAFMRSLGLYLVPIDWRQFSLAKIQKPVMLLESVS